MSAVIESITKISQKACEIAENRITSYFQSIDENKDKAFEPLKVSSLADDIARELNISVKQSLQILSLYIQQRQDLEIKTHKNGGIWRAGAPFPKQKMGPKECALKHYELVKNQASRFIEESFLRAEKGLADGADRKQIRLNFQELCDEISLELDIKSYNVYHCLRQFINNERRDLKVELGRYGGLMRR